MKLVMEKAIKYYPIQWSKEMLAKLVLNGKLTEEEYKTVTGEDFSQTEETSENV